MVNATLTQAGERFAAWPIDVVEVSRSGVSERQFTSLDELRARVEQETLSDSDLNGREQAC